MFDCGVLWEERDYIKNQQLRNIYNQKQKTGQQPAEADVQVRDCSSHIDLGTHMLSNWSTQKKAYQMIDKYQTLWS